MYIRARISTQARRTERAGGHEEDGDDNDGGGNGGEISRRRARFRRSAFALLRMLRTLESDPSAVVLQNAFGARPTISRRSGKLDYQRVGEQVGASTNSQSLKFRSSEQFCRGISI
ncbi:hypothetical protein PUN28_019775 [Cardiocondyla obscurior]|uniref:Uncharacterized protein n=1 Tax=Cardiocondyla obscurior TaxID=286306 RepID=A0AAW2EBA6_9HYME